MVVLGASHALATVDDGVEEAPNLPPGVGLDYLAPDTGVLAQGQVGTSFTKMADDMFVQATLGILIVGPEWTVAPRLPLRFLAVDHGERTQGLIRREDWDEPADFARLIAFAQYGQLGSEVHVRFGELPGVTLGTGNLVRRYYNTLLRDHYQAGVYADLDFEIAGGQLLLDNVFMPELVAARPFVRPLALITDLPLALRRLQVEAVIGADFQAPLSLEAAPRGIARDRYGASRVSARRVLAMVSGALQVPVLSLEAFEAAIYGEVSSVGLVGYGVHAGIELAAEFDALSRWSLRAEYRHVSGPYVTDYVRVNYEVERAVYRAGLTKQAWMDGITTPSGHGLMVESSLKLVGVMDLELFWASREPVELGRWRHDLVLRLRLHRMGPVSFSAFAASFDFTSIEALVEPTSALLVANLKYNPVDFFYLRARLLNEWWLRPSSTGSVRYQAIAGFDVGLGFEFRL